MHETSWHLFYQSDLQAVYAPLVVPLAFLAYRLTSPTDTARAVVPGAARFVSFWTIVFAIETIVDPIATGPLIKNLSLGDSIESSAIPFLFVYLGDLRVLFVAIGVARPERRLGENLKWAGGLAFVVPLFSGVLFQFTRWLSPEANGQLLWMFYEFGFLVLSVYLGRFWVDHALRNEPAKAAFFRAVCGYSAAYYALWLSADLLIIVGGLDLGWAIRIVPNQLYYAFWVPFVYWRFFSGSLANADR